MREGKRLVAGYESDGRARTENIEECAVEDLEEGRGGVGWVEEA
jgi:hypothetical protein